MPSAEEILGRKYKPAVALPEPPPPASVDLSAISEPPQIPEVPYESPLTPAESILAKKYGAPRKLSPAPAPLPSPAVGAPPPAAPTAINPPVSPPPVPPASPSAPPPSPLSSQDLYPDFENPGPTGEFASSRPALAPPGSAPIGQVGPKTYRIGEGELAAYTPPLTTQARDAYNGLMDQLEEKLGVSMPRLQEHVPNPKQQEASRTPDDVRATLLSYLNSASFGASSKMIPGMDIPPASSWKGVVGESVANLLGFLTTANAGETVLGPILPGTKGAMIGQSARRLGQLTAAHQVIPALSEESSLPEAGYRVGKAGVQGAAYGSVFPISAEFVPNPVLRTAGGTALLNGKSLTDVVMGVGSGKMTPQEATKRLTGALMDAYFFATAGAKGRTAEADARRNRMAESEGPIDVEFETPKGPPGVLGEPPKGLPGPSEAPGGPKPTPPAPEAPRGPAEAILDRKRAEAAAANERELASEIKAPPEKLRKYLVGLGLTQEQVDAIPDQDLAVETIRAERARTAREAKAGLERNRPALEAQNLEVEAYMEKHPDLTSFEDARQAMLNERQTQAWNARMEAERASQSETVTNPVTTVTNPVTDLPAKPDLENMSHQQLRRFAEAQGIADASQMKRGPLVDAIEGLYRSAGAKPNAETKVEAAPSESPAPPSAVGAAPAAVEGEGAKVEQVTPAKKGKKKPLAQAAEAVPKQASAEPAEKFYITKTLGGGRSISNAQVEEIPAKQEPQRVVVPGMESRGAFAYKADDGWVITDIPTGSAIIKKAPTIEAGIDAAAKIVKDVDWEHPQLKKRTAAGEKAIRRAAEKREKEAAREAEKKASAEESKQVASSMSDEEWLQKTRFYRSGKDKMAELPTGERVILRKESTAENFREQSREFLLKTKRGRAGEPPKPPLGDIVVKPIFGGKETVISAGEQAPGKAKEPWEMTRSQLSDEQGMPPNGVRLPDRETGQMEEWYGPAAKVRHKELVAEALAQGKPVPPEVLADYPDLAAKAKGAPEPAKAKEPWQMTQSDYVGENLWRHFESPESIVGQTVGYSPEFVKRMGSDAEYGNLRGVIVSAKPIKGSEGKYIAEVKFGDNDTRRIHSSNLSFDNVIEKADKALKKAAAAHEAAVKQAIDEGKIASHPNYPDLTAKAAPAPEPKVTWKKATIVPTHRGVVAIPHEEEKPQATLDDWQKLYDAVDSGDVISTSDGETWFVGKNHDEDYIDLYNKAGKHRMMTREGGMGSGDADYGSGEIVTIDPAQIFEDFLPNPTVQKAQKPMTYAEFNDKVGRAAMDEMRAGQNDKTPVEPKKSEVLSMSAALDDEGSPQRPLEQGEKLKLLSKAAKIEDEFTEPESNIQYAVASIDGEPGGIVVGTDLDAMRVAFIRHYPAFREALDEFQKLEKGKPNEAISTAPRAPAIGGARPEGAGAPQAPSEEPGSVPPASFSGPVHPATGEPFEEELWRSPNIGEKTHEFGAFYSPDEGVAGQYVRGVGINAIVKEKVRLESPLVYHSKEEALSDLGIDPDELSESGEDQDRDFYIDQAIYDEAKRQGYDGVVYLSEDHPEVHVFSPPKSGEKLPGWTVQGKPEARPEGAGAPQAPSEEPGEGKGLKRVFDRMTVALGNDMPTNNQTLQQIMREAFGQVQGHARDAYDAAEAAMNRVINGPRYVDFSKPEETLDRLLKLTDLMPRQTTRTEEQVELQQFSTPPGEAFVVAKTAAIAKGMDVLEPSAGTGNIATMARLAGARVDVNEIDPRRRALLEMLKFKPTSVDAEQLDNFLPEKQYDVIVMNPPFSATGGRVKGHNTEVGAEHVRQALLRLKPGGRLVAIVGRGMAYGRPKLDPWWQKIEEKYHVRANIGMDGKFYGKFGTGFDNQILVIDNTGPTPGATRAERVAQVIDGEGLSPQAALELLAPLAKEDIGERIRSLAGEKGEPSAGAPEPPAAAQGKEPAPRAGAEPPVRPGGEPEPPAEPSGAKPGTVPRVERPGRPKPVAPEENAPQGHEPGGEPGSPGEGRPGGAEGVGGKRGEPGAGRSGLPSDPVAEGLSRATEKAEKAEAESEVYSTYVVQKARFKGAVKHPANIVESATMASVEPPDVTYTPTLPAEVVKEGRLSDVQIEAITYAGQRHSQTLPSGVRAGYWIGDGTGVGKGREIAGIILDNFMQGRKKAVWVSIAHQLENDAKRDMEGVGVPLKTIAQRDFRDKEDITAPEGVLFTTYSQLRHQWKKGRERFNQAIKWIGDKDFDGVIVFDEAHQLKNAVAGDFGGEGTIAAEGGSDQGEMGITLQREFPKAKVVYVSATGATVARNMAYMERLGLWGTGAPFADFPSYLQAIHNGGVAAMEMLARDLKAIGAYTSRAISYQGVEYDPIQHNLTSDERAQYNMLAAVFSDVRKAFEEAQENAQQPKGGSQFSQFYSTQQRFFLQVMMSYQLPDMLAAADRDLAEGRSIIINVFNTNEGATTRQAAQGAAEGVDLEEMDFTPRQMLVDLVERHFPTQQFQEVSDPVTGKKRRVPMEDAAGNPVLNKENVRKRNELLETVSQLHLPDNVFDQIVNHFGPTKIAEISGRHRRLEGKKLVRRAIKGISSKQLNGHETKLFQEGKKRVAIISGAAATGISLHSDQNAKNQQRRVFYAMQLSWSADTQMQAFGRAHRSFQKSAPMIRLLTVDLAGQKRLTNAVSKRLASLGAITRGGREALGGNMFDVEDLTDDNGEAALQVTYKSLPHAILESMGVVDASGNVKKNVERNVDMFMNRIMGLPFDAQNRVFGVFYDNYRRVIEMKKEQGRFDLGVEKIVADNLRMAGKPEVVYTDPLSGAKTQLVELHGEVKTDRLTFDNAKKAAVSGTKWIKNLRSGMIYRADPPTAENYKSYLTNPRRNVQAMKGEQEGVFPTFGSRYEVVSPAEAERLWMEQYAKIPEVETKKFHLLSGAIFPIYNKVMGGAGEGLKHARVARTELKDGSLVVGLRLPSGEIAGVKQRLGIGTALAEASPADIIDIARSGGVIELDNGWQIKGVRVSGEPRIELDPMGKDMGRHAEIKAAGFQHEILNHRGRYFLPMDPDAAEATIATMLKSHKAIRDVTSKSGGSAERGGGGGGGAAYEKEPGAPEGRKRRTSRGIESKGNPYKPNVVETAEGGAKQGLEMPELVELARQIAGSRPVIRKLRSARGMFRGGKIALDPGIFGDPHAAAKTLAHEIGHLIDWLPDRTLKRGNLWGRLLTLRGYVKGTVAGKVRKPTMGAKKHEPITVKQLLNQLWDLSKEWKPLGDAAGDPAYVRYRRKGSELYADALSVMLNSPGTVERMAPDFYREFLANLDAKPEVRDAYDAVQALLGGPREKVVEARVGRLREGFSAAEEKRQAIIAEDEERARLTPAKLYQNFRFHFSDKNVAILHGLSNALDESHLPHDQNPRYLLEEAAQADSRNMELLRRIDEEVTKPVMEATNLELRDATTLFGDFLFHERIAQGDRSDLANPGGITRAAARERLGAMKKELGEDAYRAVEAASERFHEMVFEVSERAVEAGLYGRGTFERLIKPNKRTYATFEVVDYLEANLPSTIKASKGTFKDIGNPYSSTLLKTATLNRAIAYNLAKRGVVKTWTAHELGIEPAEEIKSPEGRRVGWRDSKNKDLSGRIEMMEDGKLVAFNVDPYVAGAFENMEPEMMISAVRILTIPQRYVFHPLWITFNTSFQAANLVKDFQRSWKAGMSLRELLVNYWRVQPSAHRRAMGVTDAMVAEMIDSAALDVPLSHAIIGSAEEDTYERELKRRALGEGQLEAHKSLLRPWRFVEYVGDRIEATAKLAGWEARKRTAFAAQARSFVDSHLRGFERDRVAQWLGLKRGAAGRWEWTSEARASLEEALRDYVENGVTPPNQAVKRAFEDFDRRWSDFFGVERKRVAYEVRNYTGTPNFRRKGKSTYLSNALFTYSNIFVQGWRGDYELATDPKTRGGWWMKTAILGILPALLQAAAEHGLFGETMQEWCRKVSTYNKTRYLLIPLGFGGEGEDRKAVGLRIPLDESTRVAHALTHLIAMAPRDGVKGVQSLFDYGAAEVPGINQAIALVAAWGEYLAGGDPQDSFLDKSIIPEQRRKAGLAAGLKPMLAWTISQGGGLMQAASTLTSGRGKMELALKLTPWASRFVLFSSAGEIEQSKKAEADRQAAKAEFYLSLPNSATKLAGERSRILAKPSAERTTAERKRAAQLSVFERNYELMRKGIAAAEKRGDKKKADEIRGRMDALAARFK